MGWFVMDKKEISEVLRAMERLHDDGEIWIAGERPNKEVRKNLDSESSPE